MNNYQESLEIPVQIKNIEVTGAILETDDSPRDISQSVLKNSNCVVKTIYPFYEGEIRSKVQWNAHTKNKTVIHVKFFQDSISDELFSNILKLSESDQPTPSLSHSKNSSGFFLKIKSDEPTRDDYVKKEKKLFIKEKPPAVISESTFEIKELFISDNDLLEDDDQPLAVKDFRRRDDNNDNEIDSGDFILEKIDL